MKKMSIKEAQKRASSLLKKHNIHDAELEAEVMVKHLYGWERHQLFLHWDQPITDENNKKLEQWIARRLNHEPLQYIVGVQEFYGRPFHVNSHVLIPRPETELLVEAVIKEAETFFSARSLTVADIGTGSGAIAVTLALEKNDWLVHAVDIDQKAIETAKNNAKQLHATVTFHHGSLLDPLIQQKIMPDMIISNPPYIPTGHLSGLMEEVRDYEPLLALDGGNDGLDFYRAIIKQSEETLRHPGMIAFEIGIDQSKAIEALLQASEASVIKTIKDFQGIPRLILATYE